MADRDRSRERDPVAGGVELGGFRGVVLDAAAAVKTVTEPPREPAQPVVPDTAGAQDTD